MTLRGLLLVWHRRVGLALALLLLLSATTGAVLVFREQIKPARPEVEPVESPVPLERIVAAAVGVGDGSPATDIGLPQGPREPYVVWLDDDAETEVYLDGNARVVEARAGIEGFTRWMFRLHSGEAFGPLGTWISLVVGVGLIAMVCSGTSVALARGRRRQVKASSVDPPAP